MRRAPAWLRVILIVPPLVLAIYWAATGSGLYDFLIVHLGSRSLDESFNERRYRYYPMQTFFIMTLLLLLPSLAILDLVGRRAESKEAKQ